MTTVLGTCWVSPPPGATAELTVPLSFFDITWLHFHPIRCLLFYRYSCSRTEFLEAVVPKLKQSLSLTLKNYRPVAGNLVYPSDTQGRPVIRYVAGDAITLTIAESSNNFDELVGYHARNADQFYDFVPQLTHIAEGPGCIMVPLLALQVTVFPGRGICVGFSNHHSLGDACSIVGLMLAWASTNEHSGDEEFQGESLPIFDRGVMKDTTGIDTTFWKAMRQIPFQPSSSFPLPTNRVRATFILTQADINKLKDLVLAYKPSLLRVSSFVVTTAYAWTCLVKSGDAVGKKVEENESEVFHFPADVRGRPNALINPPVPANYFGNCIGGGVVDIEHKKVVGGDGFLIAAVAIAEEINYRVYNKDEFLKDAENWPSNMQKFNGIQAVGVACSPKFDLTNVDFGWGKTTKLEIVSIDGDEYAISLSKSRDSGGGLQVGLSLPKERMEAFSAIFAHGK